MSIAVRSFAKINLGLRIGALRPDGFHELRTVYQTIGLHDIVRVKVERGTGIEIRCEDPRVPKDESNTCYRIAECAMDVLKSRGRVIIEIEKRLPVQGGLGGASGNAVAALLALEHVLKKELPGPERLRIAAEVGSDLPLFLIGGTVLGVGHGEEVYPLPDLPPLPCVVALPDIAVSTPKAFAEWDRLHAEYKQQLPVLRQDLKDVREMTSGSQSAPSAEEVKLTEMMASDRMTELGRGLSAWPSEPYSGAPPVRRGRAENPLLWLVRAGIENDFEGVVFPEYPQLGQVKRALVRAGAKYASLSGSGSAVYGLFRSRLAARKAAAALARSGIAAAATMTLTRRQYWKQIFDC
jgi:4-diphosphocytidyl-2-C-methyl-D-erythritol kinase